MYLASTNLKYMIPNVQLYCQAIREGADAVVAVGGDGTLHEVHDHPLLKNNNLVLSLQASNFVILLILKRKRQMCIFATSFPCVHQNVH